MTDIDNDNPLTQRLVTGRLAHPGVVHRAELASRYDRSQHSVVSEGLVGKLYRRMAPLNAHSGDALVWPRAAQGHGQTLTDFTPTVSGTVSRSESPTLQRATLAAGA